MVFLCEVAQLQFFLKKYIPYFDENYKIV
jgi:hypothetical protein